MTHSTPLIMGNPKGAPHSTFVDTHSDPTSGYYDDGDADFDLTRPEHASEMRVHDTLPSMPAPLYKSKPRRLPLLVVAPAKSKHRPLPLLVVALALVALCAAPFVFFR